MIVDGRLTHPPLRSALLEWPPSTTFSQLVLSVAATLFALQAVSLLDRLTLARKPRNRASAAAIHMLLLRDQSALQQILAAVLRSDVLDRRLHASRLPERHVRIRRTARRIPATALARLLLVLLSGPILSALSVALTFERTVDLSFSTAAFGGLALSYEPNISRIPELTRFAGPCHAVSQSLPLHPRSSADFFVCAEFLGRLNTAPERPRFNVVAMPSGAVRFELGVAPTTAVVRVYADVQTADASVFRIAQRLSKGDAERLLQKAVEILCGSSPAAGDVTARATGVFESRVDAPYVHNISADLPCEPNQELVNDQLYALSKKISLVPHDRFDVLGAHLVPTEDAMSVLTAGDDPPPFRPGGSLAYQTLRRPLLSPLLYILLVVGVLMLRAITHCFTHHDVYDGLDIAMRAYLGVDSRRRWLRDDRVLNFGLKFQKGEDAYFGVPMEDQCGAVLVDEFTGQPIIGENLSLSNSA